MNIATFSVHHLETPYPVLWFTERGKDMTRIERVFLAKQLLDKPRAAGRG